MDKTIIRPARIQRKRETGWRKPPGAIYVGRPTMWGNRWIIGSHSNFLGRPVGTLQEAADVYRALMWQEPHHKAWVRERLAGHDLMCWCSLDQPCHADYLLELANSHE